MNFYQLFHQLDEPNSWEFPSRFDYDQLNREVRAVWRELESQLGRTLPIEDGSRIQDASFHADIILWQQQSGKVIHRVSLRFSNFGNMVTLTDEESVPDVEYRIIQSTLHDHGFTYVPTDELEKEYYGVIPDRRTIGTWWIRYFDYQ